MCPMRRRNPRVVKQKFQNNSNGSNSSSSGQKQTSTGPGKQCYRCKKPFTQGHEKVCKAIKAKCDACGIVGHYQIACRKSGNFPQKANSTSNPTGRMNVAAAVGGNPSEADFFDEQGLLKEYQPKVMDVLSGTSSDKPIMIEFGCGLTPLSIDRKLTLQVDTGADANAINKKTFDQLFPEVELEESTFILKNFDKRLIKPIGSFRCFLRWKGHKYRVQIEVMGTDTPNILSRETTFVMGILKKCFITEKVSIKQNTPNSLISGPTAEERTDPSTEGVFCHSVLPAVVPAQVPSTEGVFSLQIHPRKLYFAIQLRQWKKTQKTHRIRPQKQPRCMWQAVRICRILQFLQIKALISNHFPLQICLSLKIGGIYLCRRVPRSWQISR